MKFAKITMTYFAALAANGYASVLFVKLHSYIMCNYIDPLSCIRTCEECAIPTMAIAFIIVVAINPIAFSLYLTKIIFGISSASAKFSRSARMLAIQVAISILLMLFPYILGRDLG